jgi:DEAD/DEAH box helicase domain-containing protein
LSAFLSTRATKDQLLALRVEEATAGSFVDMPTGVAPELKRALTSNGFDSLYSHQAAVYQHASTGQDVVISTSTASGKSLSFNLPVVDAILKDPTTTALYLYPTKALANDQLLALAELRKQLGAYPTAAVFTGDTPKNERAQLMTRLPNVLIGNPDIVHYQQLADHMAWETWWTRLRWVVIDEAHVYRGVFGAHVAHVLRRLLRIAQHYGSRPTFIAASATIANPVELVSALTGRTPVLVDRSGSPRHGRDIVIWQPPIQRSTPTGPIYESAEVTAAEFVVASLIAGKSCIAFARSRRVVERIRRDVMKRLLARKRVDLLDFVRAYRAGYEPALRREIERDLRTGRTRAVISTIALELGIDIGALDVAILAGYPGSGMSFWQQAGRAGRRSRALVVMIASQNPLDQFIATHPDRLVSGPVEDAVVDLANDEVASRQLTCAARELTLRDQESETYGSDVLARINTAEKLGWVVRGRRGWVAAPGHGRPDSVSLRGIVDARYSLMASNEILGEIESRYVPREAHEGAIYLHDGEPFRVEAIDDDLRLIFLRKSEDGVLTDPRGDRAIRELDLVDTRRLGPIEVQLRALEIIDEVTGYVELGEETKKPRGSPFELERPRTIRVETIGIRFTHDGATGEAVHAEEHLIRALGSVAVICDPGDLEGHTEVDTFVKAYVYDRTAGGIGLTKRLFLRLDEVLAAASARVRECKCEAGCPACVQSGTCMRRNEALSKYGAAQLLEEFAGRGS